MSIPSKYLAILEADNFYHIYNRTNNREILFRSDENYGHFLRLYTKYIRPLCKTYSQCLLSNHFHFLIQVREMERLLAHMRTLPKTNKLVARILNGHSVRAHQIVSNAFNKLFTAYAMAFNKAWNRKGNLFHRPFKRVLVRNDEQLISTAIYIHTNPRHHGVTDNFEDYPWTSYRMVLEWPGCRELAFLLDQFGGKEAYIAAHQSRADDMPDTAIEDRLQESNKRKVPPLK